MSAQKYFFEYIWIDADGITRSKTKVSDVEYKSVSDYPIWNFDGSSTKQAVTGASDVIIRPVAVFVDPFRGAPHKLVLTECLNPDMTPHETNHRAKAAKIFEKFASFKCQYGIEQEYLLQERGTSKHEYVDADGQVQTEVTALPYKWLSHNKPGLGPQGPYYCSAGGGLAIGREVAEEHLLKCVAAGVKICGLNAEVMPSQWEFQIGICQELEMGDHLHVARYILARVAEKSGIVVTLHPKPYKGDWNGSGLHTNYSTVDMREGKDGKDGLEFIKEAAAKLCVQEKHDAHMKVYGEGNEFRLTGTHETADMKECTWGCSDRGRSIRIPVLVVAEKKGYMEDRRVASNADPYLVTSIIAETTCE